MERKILFIAGLVGLTSSLVFMALSYLGNVLLGFPFLPFVLFDWMTRILPGFLIETVIQSMVTVINVLNLGATDTTAKLAEQIQSLFLVAGTGVVFAVLLALLAVRRRAWLKPAGTFFALFLWLGIVLAEFSLRERPNLVVLLWFALLVAGWSVYLIYMVRLLASVETADVLHEVHTSSIENKAAFLTRRHFVLLSWGSVVSLLLLAFGLDRYRRSNGQAKAEEVVQEDIFSDAFERDAAGRLETTGPAASPDSEILESRIEVVAGTRDEITPTGEFYRIDINSLPAEIDAQSWRLRVHGLVKNERLFSLEDLFRFPLVTQAVTMSCISNPVGGDLIGSAYWSGLRLWDLLEEVGLSPDTFEISMRAADGFFESLPLEEARDERTLLVYAMNGEPLPARHGFPLRIYIPGHYGMKQPKWIRELEAIAEQGKGYWVERGWSRTAAPQTTAVIDSLSHASLTPDVQGRLPVGGIAWAGERGISQVEIQIDGGDWLEAQLRTPALSPLTWVQWRYDGWQPSPGKHTVSVRAVDGTGVMQSAASARPAPEGATGLHTLTVTI